MRKRGFTKGRTEEGRWWVIFFKMGHPGKDAQKIVGNYRARGWTDIYHTKKYLDIDDLQGNGTWSNETYFGY